MALSIYRKKRDFRKSPEPRGGRRRKRETLTFVVQKHAARRLHYDFRLEMEGVLRSWAVPKGPSLDPAQKRLAVHVEDHPIEYGGFEGEIPKGEYGAGTVEIWDRGEWIPRGDPVRDYRAGRLKFELRGRKLHGGWALVRMKDGDPSTRFAPSGRGSKENWLLIKENDSSARTGGEIVDAEPGSVLRPKPRKRDVDPSTLTGAVPGPLPAAVEPQLATLVEAPPEGTEWLHEIKFDGYRILCFIDGDRVRLLTRHGLDWTDKFPTLATSCRALKLRQALIDGELVSMTPEGRTDFQALQNALSGGRERDLEYYAFDLLHVDGLDLRRTPLVERKRMLESVLSRQKAIHFSDHVQGQGEEFFRQACDFALEGVVSKLADGPHRPGRHHDWLKVKCLQRQEFVIGGYTAPGGTRSHFGSLLLGVQGDHGLVHVGRAGTGFTERSLEDLMQRMKALRRDSPPFANPPRERGITWIEPILVAEVAFSGWTQDGILRHPRFEGLREDKAPEEIVRERPERAPGHEGVKLTNPDRVFYPEAGITKLDLVRFYEAIEEWVLPFVINRPLSVVRCPSGYSAGCFYQKHVTVATPKQVHSVTISEGDGEQPYHYIRDLAGLIALVQLGTLEIHPWGARVDDVEKPDVMTIDLDPSPEVGWPRVVEGAVRVRDLLDSAGLRSFVKTTGGKGLHVVVPLSRRHTWDELKGYAKSLAEEMTRRWPLEYVANISKAKRKGKILVDYLRNGRGATAVAAYSTRARAGAPVSVPVDWRELADIRGDAFTVRNVRERIRTLREDPWRDYHGLKQTIPKRLR